MKKIALCLSGNLRTFETCSPNLFCNIINPIREKYELDIFTVIYENENPKKIEKSLEIYKPLKAIFIKEPKYCFPSEYKTLPIIEWRAKSPDLFIHNNYCMHYGIFKCIEVVDETYSHIIRCRYDLSIETLFDLDDINDDLYVGKDHKYELYNKPTSLNDTFAFGPRDLMIKYSNFYNYFYNILDEIYNKKIEIDFYNFLYKRTEPTSMFRYYLDVKCCLNYKDSSTNLCIIRENMSRESMNKFKLSYINGQYKPIL